MVKVTEESLKKREAWANFLRQHQKTVMCLVCRGAALSRAWTVSTRILTGESPSFSSDFCFLAVSGFVLFRLPVCIYIPICEYTLACDTGHVCQSEDNLPPPTLNKQEELVHRCIAQDNWSKNV